MLKLQQSATGGFLQKRTERREAMVPLAESGLAALQCLLDHGAPDLSAVAALLEDVIQRRHHHIDGLLTALLILTHCRFLLLGFRLGFFLASGARTPGQIIVENEFVAVGGQQIRGGAFDPHPHHRLVVFTQLADQRRKIGVPAQNNEGIHMRLCVAKIQSVNDHPDVSRILTGLPYVGDFDQLERCLMH